MSKNVSAIFYSQTGQLEGIINFFPQPFWMFPRKTDRFWGIFPTPAVSNEEAHPSKLFSKWVNLVKSKKNRRPWLVLFKYYLLIALFLIAPIAVRLYGINKKKQY